MERKYGEKRRIYNMTQADFFIQNGCVPVGAGVSKNNHAFVMFIYDDNFEETYQKWIAH